MTAYSTGYITGMVVFYGAIIFLGFYFGDRLAKKKGMVGLVKWPMAVSFAFVFLALLSQCSSKAEAEQHPIQVDIITGAPASPLTHTVSISMLRDFEKGASDKLSKVVNRALRPGESPFRVTSSASTVHLVKSTVIKIESKVEGIPAVIQFSGVLNGRETMVICRLPLLNPAKFKYSGSDCEKNVSEVFGTSGLTRSKING